MAVTFWFHNQRLNNTPDYFSKFSFNSNISIKYGLWENKMSEIMKLNIKKKAFQLFSLVGVI